jgi:lipoyl(octanoyl) transferase
MKTLDVIDLGNETYADAFARQEKLVEKRKSDSIPDTLLLVEHEPIYTLGRNAKEGNITASPEELAEMNISIQRTTRGGEVTYHGPGQLVGYPIIDLKAGSEGVADYVTKLEEVIIQALAQYEITATRDPKNRGVWVGDKKVAALGVRVTRGVTMHGFSINVNVNLDHYAGMVPCGIEGKGVTSLHELVPDVMMTNVKEDVVKNFRKVFGY